jgi:hypothetical protein
MVAATLVVVGSPGAPGDQEPLIDGGGHALVVVGSSGARVINDL